MPVVPLPCVFEVGGRPDKSAQGVVAVALRQTSLVSLDELLAVVREFLNLKSFGFRSLPAHVWFRKSS